MPASLCFVSLLLANPLIEFLILENLCLFFFPLSKDRKIIFNETETVSKVMDSCNIHVHNVIKLVTGRSRNFKIFEQFKSSLFADEKG